MEILFFTIWMALITVLPVFVLVAVGFMAVDLITSITTFYEKSKRKTETPKAEPLFH